MSFDLEEIGNSTDSFSKYSVFKYIKRIPYNANINIDESIDIGDNVKM
jgi:hypothetical protein